MSVTIPRAVVSGTTLVACAAVLLGTGAVGCSSLDAAGETCEDYPGSSCDPELGMADPALLPKPEDMPTEWRCISEADSRPAASGTPPARITYLVPVVDFNTQLLTQPLQVPGAQVIACENSACTPPEVPQVVVQQNPDNPILWQISVPYGFEISLRVTAPGYVPSDYYPGGPMVGLPPDVNAPIFGQAITMLREEALATLYRQIGLPEVDQSRGILAVRTLNCARDGMNRSTRAPGVRIELVSGEPARPADPPPQAVPWVLSTGSMATKDDVGTDGRGAAGFANLVPQTYRVRGIAPAPVGAANGTPYGVALGTVRPGVITVVEARDGQGVFGQ